MSVVWSCELGVLLYADSAVVFAENPKDLPLMLDVYMIVTRNTDLKSKV